MVNTHSDELLEALDSWVDGQTSAAGAEEFARAVREDEALGQEAESLRQLGRVLQAERVEVRPDFPGQVAQALALEDQREAGLIEFLEAGRVPVQDGFCAAVVSRLESETAEDRRVAAFLTDERVTVRPDFTDQVMAAAGLLTCNAASSVASTASSVASTASSVEGAAGRASADRLWARWGLAAAALLALASGLLFSSAGDSSLGLLGTLGEVGMLAVLAGSGMLGATWAAVGATVDSWLGASLLNWSVALLVTAGLVFLCARSVRRQRVRVERD